MCLLYFTVIRRFICVSHSIKHHEFTYPRFCVPIDGEDENKGDDEGEVEGASIGCVYPSLLTMALFTLNLDLNLTYPNPQPHPFALPDPVPNPSGGCQVV